MDKCSPHTLQDSTKNYLLFIVIDKLLKFLSFACKYMFASALKFISINFAFIFIYFLLFYINCM